MLGVSLPRLDCPSRWLALMLAGWLGGLLPPGGPLSVPPRLSAQELQNQEAATAPTLSLPSGPVLPGRGDRLLVRDESGDSVVGKRHVSVGDQHLVMLPDGRLEVRANHEVTATDRPFEPMSMDVLAERLKKDFPGFQVRTTRRYLYVFNTSDNFALATSRILETMFPGIETYCRRQGLDVHDPEVPLVAIMFRTEAEFQKFQRMPPGVVAYYNGLTNHIVMYEESRLGEIQPELGIQQSISTIAHEGVHQILSNIGVQKRLSRWPMWISEGLAEFFAPTSTERRLKWKGAGQVNDLRMFELEQYIKAKAFSGTPGQMIEQTVAAPRLASTGYATAWALTHYLAKYRRQNFDDYLRDVSQTEPLEGPRPPANPDSNPNSNSNSNGSAALIPENLTLFRRHFGDDLVSLEQELLNHLQKLPYNDPFAGFPHFVAMVLVPAERGAIRQSNIFHTQQQAETWSTEFLGQFPAAQRQAARSSIQRCANRVQAEAIARRFAAGQ